MKETVERELKLSAAEGFVLPELGGHPLPSRTFVSTYHDTEDLVLARHGVTFRHRVEDGTGLWQLKLPKGFARIELEQRRPAGPPAGGDARAARRAAPRPRRSCRSRACAPGARASARGVRR